MNSITQANATPGIQNSRYLNQIPLSKGWVSQVLIVLIFGGLAGFSFYMGLLRQGWALKIYGATLSPGASQVLLTLLGVLLVAVVVNQLIKTATIGRITPFAITFTPETLTFPVSAPFRGLRLAQVDWTQIKGLSLTRSNHADSVEIALASGQSVTLPGEFFTKAWPAGRIAEAIQHELARRGASEPHSQLSDRNIATDR